MHQTQGHSLPSSRSHVLESHLGVPDGELWKFRGGDVVIGLFNMLPMNQERKRQINLRKIVGTPARCLWDTRRDKQGSTTGRCPSDFLVRTQAGYPMDNRPSRGFSETLCDFFSCAFSAPQLSYHGESLGCLTLWLKGLQTRSTTIDGAGTTPIPIKRWGPVSAERQSLEKRVFFSFHVDSS